MANRNSVKTIASCAKKYRTTTTMKYLKTRFYLSTGNNKLKSTNDVLFLIWNIPSVKTCPFRTHMCEKACYAHTSERLYPTVLPCRERNLEFSKSAEFVPLMIEYFKHKLNHLRTRRYPHRVIRVRIHESGDFYSLEYLMKWLIIISYFHDDDRIMFMAYTKSVRFLMKTNFQNIHNLEIRFSLWEDTSRLEYNLAQSLNLAVYTAFDRKTGKIYENLTIEDLRKSASFFHCECADCGHCSECYHHKHSMIAVEIHG